MLLAFWAPPVAVAKTYADAPLDLRAFISSSTPRKTGSKGLKPAVMEEAKRIARQHRAERRGENERVVLDLDD